MAVYGRTGAADYASFDEPSLSMMQDAFARFSFPGWGRPRPGRIFVCQALKDKATMLACLNGELRALLLNASRECPIVRVTVLRQRSGSGKCRRRASNIDKVIALL